MIQVAVEQTRNHDSVHVGARTGSGTASHSEPSTCSPTTIVASDQRSSNDLPSYIELETTVESNQQSLPSRASSGQAHNHESTPVDQMVPVTTSPKEEQSHERTQHGVLALRHAPGFELPHNFDSTQIWLED